jgi:glycosyltransferase involved in cell wall biosynthesis/O-antigen/teichoic acid export membrane protein
VRDPLHILLLTDRDWTHPQGGGTGTNLYGQVSRWLAWGHRVTVIAGDYPGALREERPAPNLTIHRMGTRLTVFPRAAWSVSRRLAPDADVMLEVINGIAFFTPLWPRRMPRVALVHHVHRDHYVAELGRRGAIAAWFLETLPLKLLYRGTPVLTISEAAREELRELGIPHADIHVAYLGVDADAYRRSEKTPEPTLLYLGRLKQYKRIEHVLDVLEAIPEATLDIAGEGDHRPALEAEIEARGLTERVRMHGFVDEDEKVALYGRSWVNLTASSAEGWCLSVIEAGACGTPSTALRVGGLGESIVDNETGLLADTVEQLTENARRIVRDPELRDRLGDTAEKRARGLTWEHTAEQNLEVLRTAAEVERPAPLRTRLAGSPTMQAAGLAFATLAANAIALLFTIVFARLLGADGYGSLAALVSTFLVISVPGSALQVAAARETALGRLGPRDELAATVRGWTGRLAGLLVAAIVIGVVLREPLASLVGVSETWAAAAIPATGMLWLALSLERGVLQGAGAYRPVGISIVAEASGRLVVGALLVALGAGVAGAYLGTPLAFLATGAWLVVQLRRRLGAGGAEPVHRHRLRDLIGGAWAPVAGLTLLAVLQNIDVIIVKREIGGDVAGSYAAAAVAAKSIVWVAIGVGLYLLPEATRRAAQDLDPRPVLIRALAIVAILAVPMLALFAVAPELLLRVAFGEKYTASASALVVLGAAMSLLAVAYLAVQYMLALGRTSFLWILGLTAVAEPLLLTAGGETPLGVAAVVFGLQCVAASTVLTLGLRARRRQPLAS